MCPRIKVSYEACNIADSQTDDDDDDDEEEEEDKEGASEEVINV
jgi:hypothetical protein